MLGQCDDFRYIPLELHATAFIRVSPVTFWLTIIVFSLTYFGLALGKFPGLLTDRTGIALAGAAAVLACRLLTFDEAVASIDFATISLLLGMMIVVAYLRLGGFFEVLAGRALTHFHKPSALLAIVMLLSGGLSALLVNDVVCLALTPLVLHLTRQLRLDPKPYLIGLAVASNVGSTATLTGNPQNMIIGGLSHISYLRFAARLAPVAIVGLLISYGITWLCFRKSLAASAALGALGADAPRPTVRPLHGVKKRILIKSLTVTLGAVALFFAGAPMSIVALGAAAILLLDGIRPERVYRQVDWGLLVMFAGLFVVVRAFETHVLHVVGVERWTVLRESSVAMLSLASATLSNIVSNVPAVLLFKPIIQEMSKPIQETAWLSLAMSSTLAGNLTVLGSVANLIVVENARREGVSVSLADYCRVGVPVTITTLLLGVSWMMYARY
jgi:Na+/H+ antiporter NhaD/arsenite permease-like protein